MKRPECLPSNLACYLCMCCVIAVAFIAVDAADGHYEVATSGPGAPPACRASGKIAFTELCLQWRAANAAEDTVNLTKWQIWIGAIGAVLTLGSVGAAIYAALMAGRAAKSAEKSVETASSIGQNTSRAYLTITPPILDSIQVGKRLRASFSIKNTGQTPAYDVIGWYRVIVGYKIYSSFLAKVEPFRISRTNFAIIGGFESVVPPEKAKTFNPSTNNTKNLYSQGEPIFVLGVIEYTDIFKERHYMELKYEYNRKMNSERIMTASSDANSSDDIEKARILPIEP